MKKKEWNEGLNHLDSDLVEGYVEVKDGIRKKKAVKAVWLRLGAVAACLALIVGSFLVVPMLLDDGNLVVPTPSTTGTRPDSTNVPETTEDRIRPNIPLVTIQNPSSAPQYYGMEFSDDSGPSAEINTEGISVTSKLLEVLPDTYTFYDDWDQTKFRLLKMETVKLLKGGAMSECFYFIVAEPYMTDFTLYDRFVLIDMGQYGYEYSVLYNQTKGCAEQLDTALFGYSNVGFSWLGEGVMAFDADGRFDARLWESGEDWLSCTGWPDRCNPKYKSGYTLQQAEEENSFSDGDRFAHFLADATGEAAEALSYIKSLENGLYIPKGDGFKATSTSKVSFSFRRYIGGFATNERGNISEKSVWYSKARFTEEDEKALPDLSSAFASVKAALENGLINPVHIQNLTGLTNTVNGMFGWYAKTENGVIGIIRINQCYVTENYHLYHDDAYYIVEYGSDVCAPIDRADLRERIGDYGKDFIYAGEYDEYGKVKNPYEPIP